MAAARQPKNLTLPRVRNHGTCFQAASKHEFSKWQCTINWRHQSDWTCDPTKQLNLRSARAIRLWFGHNPCNGIWIVALLPVGKVHEAPAACPGSPFERPLLPSITIIVSKSSTEKPHKDMTIYTPSITIISYYFVNISLSLTGEIGVFECVRKLVRNCLYVASKPVWKCKVH